MLFNVKNYSEMVISNKYKVKPFYPVDVESEVTERLRIMCPCSLFSFNWTNNSALEERPQIHLKHV